MPEESHDADARRRRGPDARRRLGVYVAPRATTPLGERGARWLGRHIDPLPDPSPAELEDVTPDRLADLTAVPRLYGFHATLKAPMHLAASATGDELDAAVADLAAGLRPVEIARLAPVVFGGFAALRPTEAEPGLDELAAACVTELDRFRRPASELDLARRRRGDLTPRQDELLLAWGYPYVLDEFRFHMTLTRRLEPAERDGVLDAAVEWFGPVLDDPVVVDELCVVAQEEPGEPFVVVSRHPLG